MKKDDVVAKKQFGQNFLKDESVLYKIIQAMPNTTNRVAEIGPGLGDLTKHLVDVKSVVAFEIDRDLCKLLKKEFKEEIATNTFELRCGDVLDSWQSELLDESYDLVANLPYYIATNIILKALADPQCKNILVMIQKEVALKFSANCGDKVWSSLGVITKSIADAAIVVDVPPEAFDPPPKVVSSVLLIQKFSDRSDAEFEKMLKLAFTQPRKTLQKNLSSFYAREDISKALETLNLKASIRPHETTTSDYHQLYRILTGSLDGTKREQRSSSGA